MRRSVFFDKLFAVLLAVVTCGWHGVLKVKKAITLVTALKDTAFRQCAVSIFNGSNVFYHAFHLKKIVT